MIYQNELPILEYDDSRKSVLMPDHEHLDMKLPRKAVFAFLGDGVDRYAHAHHAVTVGEFVSITKKYPVYVLDYRGESICLMQAPVGASASAQILDWLIGYGVQEVISSGSCGVLTEIEENTFLVPAEALRDEGTSYHYLPPSRWVRISQKARQTIEAALTVRNLPYTEVRTWSTDGFFRETADLVEYRRQEGCITVEMECAALAAVAQMRGIQWGMLLYTADCLACAEQYQERNWGADSIDLAMELCLEALMHL